MPWTVRFICLMSQPCASGSGIEGEVILRPLNPVERPGMSNFRPYQATLSVLDEHRSIVTRFHSGADGRFQVSLAPGVYVLRPESDQAYPWSREQTVTVPENGYISVRITYDTGIR